MDDSELIYGNLAYEKRIVSYFDVLGWRAEIVAAGNDTRRIARLASIPRIFNSAIAAVPECTPGAHITTFSDNVIVSVPYEPTILLWWLDGLATIQLALSLIGFWVRGAVTIGDLCHNSNTVFGPALNRAYELESESAVYPRILIDPLIPDLTRLQSPFVAADKSWRFLDPFNSDFIDSVKEKPINGNMIEHFNKLGGTEIITTKLPLGGQALLSIIFMRIGRELASAPNLKVWKKYAWLLDRIAPRVPVRLRSTNFTKPPD
jgi:hypothetical protein